MALKKIGVLWQKKDKNEKDFLSGSIDAGLLGEVKIMIFKNEKADDNQPHFTVHLLSEGKDE
ncbi:hypothetical protein [uncultured Desulfosarcina sp.]|uniref:hypothetical protein n=1 Tax=uncultured Desulfosarcina sp. TaxID=218289 RepID=UPI0029C66E2F|nr:hypothetical protein [uncultured Desulfosarcina sp.]